MCNPNPLPFNTHLIQPPARLCLAFLFRNTGLSACRVPCTGQQTLFAGSKASETRVRYKQHPPSLFASDFCGILNLPDPAPGRKTEEQTTHISLLCQAPTVTGTNRQPNISDSGLRALPPKEHTFYTVAGGRGGGSLLGNLGTVSSVGGCHMVVEP